MNEFAQLFTSITNTIDTLKKGNEVLANESDMFERVVIKTNQNEMLDVLGISA